MANTSLRIAERSIGRDSSPALRRSTSPASGPGLKGWETSTAAERPTASKCVRKGAAKLQSNCARTPLA